VYFLSHKEWSFCSCRWGETITLNYDHRGSASVMIYWQGKTKELGENPVPEPLSTTNHIRTDPNAKPGLPVERPGTITGWHAQGLKQNTIQTNFGSKSLLHSYHAVLLISINRNYSSGWTDIISSRHPAFFPLPSKTRNTKRISHGKWTDPRNTTSMACK
jgi:hypothetical protein